MPDYFDKYRQPPAAPAATGDYFDRYRKAPVAPTADSDDAELSPGAIGAGAVGLAAVGAMGLKAAKASGGIPGKLLAMGAQVNALGQQAMLSGFALPKSMLGGVGASVANAIERKSLSPLKTLLSGETFRDIKAGWSAGRKVGPSGASAELPKYLDAPGRAMGAVDSAIQKSLVRANVSDFKEATKRMPKPSELKGFQDDATAALLQTPLPFEDKLSGKAARYLVPFRRTPFNQFFEGFEAMGKHPGISAGYGAAGAAQGAATADEQYPVSTGFGIAASAKYGLPNAFGQFIGRKLAGGQGGGGVAGSALPVSEYGFEQGLGDPLRRFEKPAALTALEKLGLKTRNR